MSDRDRQLIKGLVTGDPDATNEFISLWQPRIYRWVRWKSWLKQTEDASQQIWFHLLENSWERLLSWEGLYSENEEHSLEAFLRQVSINKLRDLERKAQRQLPEGGDPFDIVDDGDSVGSNPLDMAERERIRRAFEECFGRLQSRDCTNLIMWYEGHKDAEIAEQLNMTANNAAQRRHQALPKLRMCLEKSLPEYMRDE
jgi:RNA polymerase sigma factor (sigma-70 family)